MSTNCPECDVDTMGEEFCPCCGLYQWDCCRDCGGDLDTDHPELCSGCIDSWAENHPDEAAIQEEMIESGYFDEFDEWNEQHPDGAEYEDEEY